MVDPKTILPKVDDAQFQGMTLKQVKEYVKTVFDTRLHGKTVRNKETGISITINKNGRKHVYFHQKGGLWLEVKGLLVIDEMLRQAKFLNFRKRDSGDLNHVIGYLHFKGNAIVEGKKRRYKIVVMITNMGKYFYHHFTWDQN